MKKENLPQDKSSLANFTREVCYVKNENGNYEQGLSTGWDVKAEALDEAWDDINERIEETRVQVLEGKKSPIAYFMELNVMDLPTLSGYSGFWPFRVKWHMKPSIFKRLSNNQLERYAQTFKISLNDLKNFDANDIEKHLDK